MSQSEAFNKLTRLLKTLFQLDQPDLDFGLYRIMHARADEISRFLDHDLLPQVQAAFSEYRTADKAELEKEVQQAVEQAKALGVDPETATKVKELRQKIAEQGVDVSGLEQEVYDHLYKFFRRYYDEGDFLAKRVYKPGVYAIPYEGEEVKLHWANKDQYYIKTSEYLRDYAFTLKPGADDPMRVHFRLVDAAEGEHGNVKEAEGKNRVFILARENFVAEEDGESGKELIIRFEYRPATLEDWSEEAREQATPAARKKPPSQKDLRADAVRRVLAVSDANLRPWLAEMDKPHIKADGKQAGYNRLAAHLNRYTARNTFDYFIHKDLGGFLRRELDFYIKNEVMFLDDIESESAPRVEQYLSKIKVIRQIASKIIDFLAQLENFQKRLWLKKKFVTETSYCIRIGCIPEEFYSEIAANEAQRQEWVELYAIDELEADLTTVVYSEPLTVGFLKAHATLIVDTRHFNEGFNQRLLEAMGDIDKHTDGVLFHGENFQALNVMQPRSSSGTQMICLDPPYNTGEDEFAYKDFYQHSSWMTMLLDRFREASRLLSEEGSVFVHIDDNEVQNLWHLMGEAFGAENYLGSMVWKRRSASAMSSTPLSLDHEYILVFGKNAYCSKLHGLEKSEESYPYVDKDTGRRYASTDLTVGMTKDQRPNQFYPIVNPRTGKVFDANPNRVWRFFPDTMKRVIENNLIIWPDEVDGALERPRYKTYFDPEQLKARPVSSWIEAANTNDRELDAEETEFELEILKSGLNAEGGRVLDRIFSSRAFAYPKPLSLVRSLVRASTRECDEVLDFFAGSGTTGHAVISLNREDQGRRRFIMVEMGDYFDMVLLPRLKKVAFTPEWKAGKPKRLATEEEANCSPRIMKIVRLESYEDALNNLEPCRTETQSDLLTSQQAQGAGGLREQYLLRYWLDVETRGGQSLLNIGAFTDPTSYRLKVKRPGSEETREVNVDLQETFNWLIGLTVETIVSPQTFTATFKHDDDPDLPEGSPRRLLLDGRLREDAKGPWWFRTVTGTTPDGRKTLVIWRKLTGEPEQDNLVLDEWFKKQGYSSKDSEFDLIYVNGDNNLENLRQPDDTWKVRLIEEDFHRLMFEDES